jgi:Zn-dependent oligopeptidase
VTDPSLRRPGLPDYPRITAEDVRAATDRGLAAADASLARALGPAAQRDGPDRERALLDRISDALRAVWTAHGQGGFLAIVHPDPEIRAAADEAGQRIEAWRAAFVRNPSVLAALEALDPLALDPEARNVRERWIAAMREAGAHLDAATRSELATLQARVLELQTRFGQNQGAEPASITVDRARLAGLPAATLEGLPVGPAPDTVVVPIELRQTVLERVADRGVREAIQRRWLAVAEEPNREVTVELTATHRRMAQLVGATSWAEARAANGVGGGLAKVRTFLDELEPPFLRARDAQLERIRAPLATELGLPAEELVIEDWDVPRGLALLRDELGADGDALREYFPLDAVLAGLARTVESVFGVRAVEVAGTFGWHEDVRRFDCSDSATGEPIGTILLDPYARPGKMAGVAGMCDALTMGGDGDDGAPARRHTAIVLFVPRPADGGTALLAPSDIEALFHELGHALDFMLGRTRFAPIDVESWIRDWTEAPSQSIGRWASLPEVLCALGRHVATGRPLPLERAVAFAAANEAGTALQLLRFLWFTRIDMAIHGPDAVDLDEVWRATWPIRGTAPATERFSPGPLTILNLGYDGVMYGFLLAQSYLEEILDRFRREGALSPIVGAAYRRELLEPGWAPDPLARMRRFLGRDPTLAPYLERLGH